MSDPGVERPRPQYGEYASPEEQRARIRQPDASQALDRGLAPAPGPAPGPQPAVAPAAARGGHPTDRVATVGLLAWGAVMVVFYAVGYLDYPRTIAESMTILGIPGEFTNVDAARTWGIVAAVVLVVGYLLTLVLTARRLRRGRIAWWIPVAGAVVTFVVIAICLSIPLMGDPAFLAYIRSTSM